MKWIGLPTLALATALVFGTVFVPGAMAQDDEAEVQDDAAEAQDDEAEVEDDAAEAEDGAAEAQDEEIKILAGEDEKPTTTAKYVPDVFEIGLDGELLFRIRSDAAGFSAAQRARIIDTRLVHAISYGNLDPDAVRIEPVRGKPTVYIGNLRLVTVYPGDVEAAGADSMQHLATIWAASTACCLRELAPWARVAETQ